MSQRVLVKAAGIGNGGTKMMKKIMKMCMFLCFHVKSLYESTKTCTFPCRFTFSVYSTFTPLLHHNGKGPFTRA